MKIPKTWLRGGLKTSGVDSVCLIAILLNCLAADDYKGVAGLPRSESTAVKYRHVQISPIFQSEGATVSDVNRDGKPDLLAGGSWYENPSWTAHKYREVAVTEGWKKFIEENPAGSPFWRNVPKTWPDFNGYRDDTYEWSEDFNGDGYPDVLVIQMHTQPILWFENPGRQVATSGLWKMHRINDGNGLYESAAYVDVNGDGKRDLVSAYGDKKGIWWAERGPHPDDPWVTHTIGAVGGAWHGLGVGDIDGDDRPDVLTKIGWYKNPGSSRTDNWDWMEEWKTGEVFLMRVYDFSGDGLNDFVSTSPHDRGIWWWEQSKVNGKRTWIKHVIADPADPTTPAETHSLELADINGDGVLDLVTGKRWQPHGPKGHAGALESCVMLWYETKRSGKQVTFVPHMIHDNSGVGIQFTLADVNGDARDDILTSNKKGVHLFLWER
jgi:FG-GAP-like repeat